jgi:signal transduction histidine kinase
MADLTQSIAAVREHERARLAAEFHDELGQRLTGLNLDLAWLKPRLAGMPAEIGARVESMKQLLDDTTAAIRRITRQLRPSMLDELGLSAAVEGLVADCASRTGLTILGEVDPAIDMLPDEHALAVFRIVQECLTNTSRHARANTANLVLRRSGHRLYLRVADDGCGAPARSLAKTGGQGLAGIRERLRLLGARLKIESASGCGFRVAADIPWPGMAKRRRAA